MPGYTVTSLIESAQRKGWLPESSALSTANLLGFFNDEAATFMQAFLKSLREEFLVNEADHDVAFSAGSSGVRVPSRAIGSALRGLSTVTNGVATPLTRVETERGEGMQSGTPSGYMLRGNLVQLLPPPSAAGTLRVAYLQRLPELVTEAECAQIAAVDFETGDVELEVGGDYPDTFFDAVAESFFPLDCIQGEPPFSPLAIDVTPTGEFADGLVFNPSSLPAALAPGDWIALAGESPIPLIPRECHKLLSTRVAYVIALTQGSPRLDALKAALDEEKENVRTLLMGRVTSAKRVVINPNGPGMRGGGRRQ